MKLNPCKECRGELLIEIWWNGRFCWGCPICNKINNETYATFEAARLAANKENPEVVKQIKLTRQQLNKATARASENSEKAIVWKDLESKANSIEKKGGEKNGE